MTTETIESDLSFEQAVARLETIVRQLEDGSLPLQQTLALFEEGTMLGRRCQELLDLAELRIKQVVQDADGSPRLVPFDGVDSAPAF